MANGEKHNPDEAEIRRESLKIQATWSAAERRKRNGYPTLRVTVPTVTVEEIQEAKRSI